MSPYLVIPLLTIVAIVQTTLLPMFLPGPVRPDLMLMLVVGWGVVHGNGQAALWGLGGGILLDLFSGAPFGLAALSLGAIGLIADLPAELSELHGKPATIAVRAGIFRFRKNLYCLVRQS